MLCLRPCSSRDLPNSILCLCYELVGPQYPTLVRPIEFFHVPELHPRSHEQSEPLTGQVLPRPEVPKHQLGVNQPRLVQAQIRSVTAVREVLRSPHHLGSHRIQVDVPDKLGEILIALAEDRLVAPLKQVAGLSVLAIVMLAISGEKPL